MIIEFRTNVKKKTTTSRTPAKLQIILSKQPENFLLNESLVDRLLKLIFF